MAKTPDELLALRFGDATVGENLQRAIASSQLIENNDGALQLAGEPEVARNWMCVYYGPSLECQFLMHFMYYNAYAKSAVPHGCHACYKVKVVPRTLRELVAAWEIGKRHRMPIQVGNRFL